MSSKIERVEPFGVAVPRLSHPYRERQRAGPEPHVLPDAAQPEPGVELHDSWGG